MKIEYSLTTKQLFKANLLLAFYRARKPILVLLVLYLLYTFFTDSSLIGFLIGVPIGLIFGAVFAVFLGLIMARRNKHYAGKRTLVITDEGYKYSGESFKRESKWSEKKKVWFTRWYIFLDTTSLYPVVIDSGVLSDAYASEIKSLFTIKNTEPRH
jgi:hypothetical protein